MEWFQFEERQKSPELAAIIKEVMIPRIRGWRFQMNMQTTNVMFNAEK